MSADVLALAKETSPGATKVSRTTTFSDSRLRDLITLREMQKTTAKIAFENWKWRPHEIASLENWESRPHEIASLAAAGVRQYRVNTVGMFHSNAQGIRHTRKVQMPREATQQQQSP